MRKHRTEITQKNSSMVRILLLSCAGILVGGFIGFFYKTAIVQAYEDLGFYFHPSPLKAVEIGNKYFNARRASEYNIERATHYFTRAEELQATFPYVQHQLARIAFLKGDFTRARAHIDSEIALYGGDNPSAYYIRALILGYQGEYLKAAEDYETYFKLVPANWAAINDYSWVLLKADLPEAALATLEWGIREWPHNAWLLHNQVIALYELGRYNEAFAVAESARIAVDKLTVEDWLQAYPGNDPLVAQQGLDLYRATMQSNSALIARILSIQSAAESKSMEPVEELQAVPHTPLLEP